jgi:hypothetical protein
LRARPIAASVRALRRKRPMSRSDMNTSLFPRLLRLRASSLLLATAASSDAAA